MNTFTATTTLTSEQIDKMCAFYSYAETINQEDPENPGSLIQVPNPISKTEFVRNFIDGQLKNLMANTFFEVNRSIIDETRKQLDEQSRTVAESSITVTAE